METKTTPNRHLHNLLVATDGTEVSNRAVSFAIAIAKRYGSSLLFCNAIDQALAAAECSAANGGLDFLELMDAQKAEAKAVVDRAVKLAADAGVVATSFVADGRPAEAIVACANDRAVDAIVMGTQGKRGLERFFLGSTAEGVLRHSDVPTFVVPAGVRDVDPDFSRILVAIDDSKQCVAAAALAHDIALTAQSTLVFCSVATSNNVSAMAATYGYDPTPIAADLRTGAAALVSTYADRAQRDAIPFETIIAEGDPAEEILETADDAHVKLIVVGTHGRQGLRRFVVGSVAEAVVRDSRVPVLVVRTGAVHASEPEHAVVGASSAQ